MASKRKRVVISIADKLAAIKEVEKGSLLKTVAANYGVGVSTVSDWVKYKSKFLEQAVKNPQRKTLKTSDFEKVGEALYLWFIQQREKGMPITGPVLQEKAKMLSDLLGDEGKDFSASSGWLDRFKNRYGIRQLNLCGEKLSADPDAVNVFKTEFEDYTQGYTKDQIYNADETGVNFKMLPKKSLASGKDSSAPGHKMKKERITVLFASNASGTHRLPPMCIGKSKKPRALKDVASNALPVFYRSQKSAWMSSQLFTEWFHEQFVPKVEKFLTQKGLPKKAILLIDNAPTHPSECRSGDITVRFLPPNVTSLIQPLDQGVIETFKRHYRGLLLKTILQDSEMNDKNMNEALKSINMKHVVYWCAEAWEKVKSDTLKNCWRKLYDGIEAEETESYENLPEMIQMIPGCENVNESEVEEWILGDDSEELSDVDIVEAVLQPTDVPEPEADDVGEEVGKVTADDGFNALEEAIQDIDLALVHGDETIPRKKVLTRKAILLNKVKRYEETLEVIKMIFPDVKDIETHENKELKDAYLDTLLQTARNEPTKKTEPTNILPSPKGGESKGFASASINASLKYSKEKGRYVVAKESFHTADVVFVEKPFALVVLPDQYHKHCHHCCKEIVAFVPCRECTKAIFCSNACCTSAWSTYHRWECKGLEVCHSIGIAHLGLRVAILADSSDNYKRVFDLITHMEDMAAEDLYQYTVTAVLLAVYLKNHTSYFESNPTIGFEKMGIRILRHIVQLVCNGHAITKIDATESEDGYSKTFGEAQKRIATAIYPSVSMLNHSCDPNISNSFFNEYLVVRASRDIKKGEEIFNCYGPHYSHEKTEVRQKLLQSQYFFKCTCVRCCNPEDGEREQFSALLCSFCAGPVMQGQGECADCHRLQPLVEMVNLALTAQELHHHSEQLLKEGHLEKALPVLEECVQISSKCLYKHNSDLRTYKDCLARVYAEVGRFGESVSLVEDCIVSIEKQFGNSTELSNELLKLIGLLQSNLTKLVSSGLKGSQEFRDKLERLQSTHNWTKKIMLGTTDNEYLNSVPGMIEAFEGVEIV